MDAHRNDYTAAVAGMAETYGVCTFAVGDRVTYRLEGWGNAHENGRVTGHRDDGLYLLVEAEDDHTQRVIDARPWPIGNVLPF